MENVWIQLIIMIGGVLGATFMTVRYTANINRKKEQAFLDYLAKRDDAQLEYYEQKNGHLERISSEFTKSINKNTSAINKLIRSK